MLVSKKVSLAAGGPAVELLAGEELEQPYEMLLYSPDSTAVHLGDSGVSTSKPAMSDFDPSGNVVFRVRNESLWAISSVATTVSVLAYSTE